jgi:cytochrome oxidase Cu insertion factor (SCO1/SenC/PrrC family)
MSDFLGEEYNYEIFRRSETGFALFRTVAHAGDPMPDFTLPSLDGEEVTLSSLRGKPMMIEFGSIT